MSHSLNLPGVNLNDANPGSDKLLAHRLSEGADGRLGGAVDASTGVRITASNASNVDNVTAAAIRSLLEDRENSLGHMDETVNVGVEHDVHIFGGDVASMGNALDKTTVETLLISCCIVVHCAYI